MLERAIRSLLDQDYPALEIIVADGGSTDESADVLLDYEHRLSVVLREPDRGQADGLNRGFRRATGDVLGWLCADDELLPGALDHVAGALGAHPEAGAVAGAAERVFGDEFARLVPIAADAWDAIGMRNTIEQPSMFWRAGWHHRAGELDTSFDLAFDWEFWCRLRRAGARLLVTDRTLSRYHFSRTNKTSTGGSRHVEEGSRIIREYGPRRSLAAVFRWIYYTFDLRGCLDHPPAASGPRMFAFKVTDAVLLRIYGDLVRQYNWHFASLQQRGLDWWVGERGLTGE